MIDQLAPPFDHDPQFFLRMTDLKKMKFLAEQYGYMLVPKAHVLDASVSARISMMELGQSRQSVDLEKLYEDNLGIELGKAIIKNPEFWLLDKTTSFETGDLLMRARVRLVSPQQK